VQFRFIGNQKQRERRDGHLLLADEQIGEPAPV
jgi:hypothetical protein